jgi:hypothetical protein
VSERNVITCDQCWKEGDAPAVPLHVESRITITSEYLEADFCTYACLIQWAIAQQDRKVAAK